MGRGSEEIRLLIDGECPLCKREGDMLVWLDRGKGRLVLEDIAAPDFDPSKYGLDHTTVNRFIHAVVDDAKIITGMEVFRRAYKVVGLGWLLAPTAWPGLRRIFDAMYLWFANNRHRLTRRSCPDGSCGVS